MYRSQNLQLARTQNREVEGLEAGEMSGGVET
jgi:hypothetical protein